MRNPYISRPQSVGSGAITAGSGGVPYVLAASGVAVSTTGNVVENILATVTIPANSLGANGIIRIFTIWTHTNSANAKTCRVRLGDIGGAIYDQQVLTTTLTTRSMRWIMNRNATNSQIGGFPTGIAFATSSVAIVTSSIDTTAPTELVFTGQNSVGSETITLESYFVEIMKMS